MPVLHCVTKNVTVRDLKVAINVELAYVASLLLYKKILDLVNFTHTLEKLIFINGISRFYSSLKQIKNYVRILVRVTLTKNK